VIDQPSGIALSFIKTFSASGSFDASPLANLSGKI
jgi:hypothetical protein